MAKGSEKKQTIATYDKTAVFHADKFDKIGARVGDIKKVFSYIKNSNPKTIELGCGNGRDAVEIIKYTDDYLGIDLSKELIKLAKKKVSGANFKIADIENFKFPNKTDVIFAFASLLHSDKESAKRALNNAYQSMSLKGVFFISLKYDKYHKKLIEKEKQGPKTFYFYTPEDIKEISPIGLDVVFEDIQNFRGQKWFSIILQKKK